MNPGAITRGGIFFLAHVRCLVILAVLENVRACKNKWPDTYLKLTLRRVVIFCLIKHTMRHISAIIVLVVLYVTKIDCVAQGHDRPNILFVIADDWSYGHAGIYGDRVVKTPNIDAVGREGAVFMNAFAASPSCTPSRAAILTGKFPHELEAGANLWGYLPVKYDNYSRILERAGYHVGVTGKGWGPGKFEAGGYAQNPAGKPYKSFALFLEDKPADKPFSFWFGSQNPHRPYERGSGEASGMDPGKVSVPGWLPDTPEIRRDILDYYYEIEQFDSQLGEIITLLRQKEQYENTLIIITGDNGMPFPRAKANLYDSGTKVPLIISMGTVVGPMEINEFVSLTDIAPTILELAVKSVPETMSGASLWDLLRKEKRQERRMVFTERERHANVRDAELGYPSRAIRTDDFLYIRNYEPDRWPAGDPELYHSVGPFGDVDASPSKEYVMNKRSQTDIAPFFQMAFAKRPTEELYDLRSDPDQKKNIVGDRKFGHDLRQLRTQLNQWQMATKDPRATNARFNFDNYPYFGPPVPGARSTYKPAID